MYLSLDINPACPNTVAEALACGAPVVGFKTGALPELVDNNCGKIIEYGSDPWDLEYPDVGSLESAIVQVFDEYELYSNNAYQRASQRYDVRDMLEKYLEVIEN